MEQPKLIEPSKVVSRRKSNAGPATREGKLAVSKNAIQHGLTALNLIPGENIEDWLTFKDGIVASLNPANAIEQELVHRIASLLWRIRRLDIYEASAIRYQVKYREMHAMNDLNSPPPDDLHALASLPDGKAADKIERFEQHLTRQLRRAFETLEQAKRAGNRHLSVLIVSVKAQNRKTIGSACYERSINATDLK